jgi:hypothetical protein
METFKKVTGSEGRNTRNVIRFETIPVSYTYNNMKTDFAPNDIWLDQGTSPESSCGAKSRDTSVTDTTSGSIGFFGTTLTADAGRSVSVSYSDSFSIEAVEFYNRSKNDARQALKIEAVIDSRSPCYWANFEPSIGGKWCVLKSDFPTRRTIEDKLTINFRTIIDSSVSSKLNEMTSDFILGIGNKKGSVDWTSLRMHNAFSASAPNYKKDGGHLFEFSVEVPLSRDY